MTKKTVAMFIFAFLSAVGCNRQELSEKVEWRTAWDVGLSNDVSYDELKFVNETWHNQLNRLKLNKFSYADLDPPVFDVEDYDEACQAIKNRDLKRLELLLHRIGDIDRISTDGMTLLYWAFHITDDPRPFIILLDNGADPNIPICTERRDMPLSLWNGSSITYLVATSEYNRLFKRVFESGGDPNVEWVPKRARGLRFTPFLALNQDAPDALERLGLLIDSGADLESGFDEKSNFAVYQLRPFQDPESFERGSRLALAAVKSGVEFKGPFQWTFYDSDKRKAIEDQSFRLIHFLAEAKRSVFAEENVQETRPNFAAIVDWLESKGESMELAIRDLEAWEQEYGKGSARSTD